MVNMLPRFQDEAANDSSSMITAVIIMYQKKSASNLLYCCILQTQTLKMRNENSEQPEVRELWTWQLQLVRRHHNTALACNQSTQNEH